VSEHVIDAVVLMRALHRDHVAGLLHHADHRTVASLVLTDPAARLIGEVEAHLTQPNLLLDLPDRIREPKGVLARGAQYVEGEPLGGAITDAGEL
jgi:hypothetical protein